jgi:hypothetical protein
LRIGEGVDDPIIASTSGDAFPVLGGIGGFATALDLATLSDELRFTGAGVRSRVPAMWTTATTS